MLKQDLEQPAGWFCIVLPQTSSKPLSWIYWYRLGDLRISLQMAFWEKNTLVIERCGPQGRFREERSIDDQGILIFKLTGLEAAVGGSIFGMGWNRKSHLACWKISKWHSMAHLCRSFPLKIGWLATPTFGGTSHCLSMTSRLPKVKCPDSLPRQEGQNTSWGRTFKRKSP